MRPILTIILLLVASIAFAQNNGYRSEVVDRFRDLDVTTGFSTSGYPLQATLGFKVVDNVIVGPEAGFNLYRSGGFKGTNLHFGARGQYITNDFFNFGNHIDTYVGLGFGYELWIYDFKKYDDFPKDNSTRLSGFIGYRQFFTGSLAFLAELHMGNYNAVHLGITYRIY